MRQIVDKYGNSALVDASTRTVTGIDYAHHEIHAGRGYVINYSALAGSAAFIEVYFRTGDSLRYPHMTFNMEAALAATIEIWRPTSKVYVAANELVPLNRDENSGNISNCEACHTPTGAETGPRIFLSYIGAATTNGKFVSSGAASSRGEIKLRRNTAYAVRVTSRAASNALNLMLDWYEHTDCLEAAIANPE